MTAPPMIQLQNVVRTLGANRVLDGISLSIYRGEITAIIGKSGSGKSVLLKHIIGLLEPDRGVILFEGRSRSTLSPPEKKALRQKFSYVFQDTALLDFLNVFDNVALPLKERRGMAREEIDRRVRGKLHQLDLHDVELKYPSQLSGGMKKRVALARALVTDPEIVLFDEPTTGLDPIRKNAVHSMILGYQRRFGFTGVVVSHEIPDIFFISQRVAMIDEGKIRFEGSPEQIQRSPDPEVKNFLEGLESPRDQLTGIDSQSIGQKRLLQEMSRLQRHQLPFSIVLMAMDHLEDIDRIAGHVAGQTVFKAFASHVTQNTYITDTCFRYAFNKILVLLPDTNEEQARSFCKKISRTFQSNSLFAALETARGLCYSVSAGVVQAIRDKLPEDLIAEAENRKTVFYEYRRDQSPEASCDNHPSS
jgi:phospholipid/cholesterol/gamma-HCH transport system ATP-binding protein